MWEDLICDPSDAFMSPAAAPEQLCDAPAADRGAAAAAAPASSYTSELQTLLAGLAGGVMDGADNFWWKAQVLNQVANIELGDWKREDTGARSNVLNFLDEEDERRSWGEKTEFPEDFFTYIGHGTPDGKETETFSGSQLAKWLVDPLDPAATHDFNAGTPVLMMSCYTGMNEQGGVGSDMALELAKLTGGREAVVAPTTWTSIHERERNPMPVIKAGPDGKAVDATPEAASWRVFFSDGTSVTLPPSTVDGGLKPRDR